MKFKSSISKILKVYLHEMVEIKSKNLNNNWFYKLCDNYLFIIYIQSNDNSFIECLILTMLTGNSIK